MKKDIQAQPITVNDLKKIIMLSYLKDEMLAKILPLAKRIHFTDRQYVFQEGESADWFYMLEMGKILFEKNIMEDVTVFIGTVKPGYSFGWSSMFTQKSYTVNAVSAENSSVISFHGTDFKNLMDAEPEMGYLFFQRLVRLLSTRLENRTEQFLRLIRHHPDMRNLFE